MEEGRREGGRDGRRKVGFKLRNKLSLVSYQQKGEFKSKSATAFFN